MAIAAKHKFADQDEPVIPAKLGMMDQLAVKAEELSKLPMKQRILLIALVASCSVAFGVGIMWGLLMLAKS